MTRQFALTGVRKYSAGRLALDLDELALYRNQLHVVTGPNGSGKSTLLNVLAFLMKPDEGEVIFDDERVDWKSDALRRLRERVTLLHQSPFLFMGTVEYNVEYGIRLRGCRGEAARQRVAESLAMVGLAGFGARNVKHLSGGERRRVALARALAVKPEVLLLDEPLANIDRETSRELELLIAALPGSGTTVVMSTHYIHDVEHLGGAIIALEDGKLDLANCHF